VCTIKARRLAALLLAALLFTTASPPAEAAGPVALDALEQYAAELSRSTCLDYYRPENTQRYMDYRAAHPEYDIGTVITHVNIGLDRPFFSDPEPVINPSDTAVLVNKYHVLPADYIPPVLEPLSSQYSIGTKLLAPAARAAFEKLCADAQSLGYALYATSAYRSYDRQAQVYADSALPSQGGNKPDPDLTAARPGFSEHQTGLAVDVTHALSPTNEKLEDSAVYKWYTKNAHKYGFILRYPKDRASVTGYAFEPWHLRYLGTELAAAVFESGLTYDEYCARQAASSRGADPIDVGISISAGIAAGGRVCVLPAYRISGGTYIRLRDLAAALSGTRNQFDVAYDSQSNRIVLKSGSPYAAGAVSGNADGQPPPAEGLAANMLRVTAVVECTGAVWRLPAYLNNHYTYLRPEQLAGVLGWTVTQGNNNIVILNMSAP
jgi:D-alanyl-D-alanine carboxypeptidase